MDVDEEDRMAEEEELDLTDKQIALLALELRGDVTS